MDWFDVGYKPEYDPAKIDKNVKILRNTVEKNNIKFSQELDLIEGKFEQTLQEDDAVSIFRQEAKKFTFEAEQINMNGHVHFGDNMSFIDGKLQITRPDGAVWMQNGMVNNEYSINGYDPYLMTYGEIDGLNKFKAFDDNMHDSWYTQVLGALDGRGRQDYNLTYKDVRDSSLRQSVRFQRYEFVHSARYLKVSYQIANNANVYQHRFILQEITSVPSGANPLQTEITFANGDTGTKDVIVDLGKPSYSTRRFDIRLGWLTSGGDWGTKDSILRFRIPRIVQTDIL